MCKIAVFPLSTHIQNMENRNNILKLYLLFTYTTISYFDIGFVLQYKLKINILFSIKITMISSS